MADAEFVPLIEPTYSTYRKKFDVQNFEPDENDFGFYEFPEKDELRILIPRSERQPTIRGQDNPQQSLNPENFGRTIQLVQNDADIAAFLDTQPREESQQDTDFGIVLNSYLNDDTLEKRISGETTLPDAVIEGKNIQVKSYGFTGSQPSSVSVNAGAVSYTALADLIKDFENKKITVDDGRKAQFKILGGVDPNSNNPIMTFFVSWCLWKINVPALKTGCSQDYRKWGINVPWHDFTQVRENDIVVFEDLNLPGAGAIGFYKGFNAETEKVRILTAQDTPEIVEYSVKRGSSPRLVAVRRNWGIPREFDNPVYYS